MPAGIHWPLRPRQAAWLTFGVGLALTAALGWELHREAVALDRQRFVMRVAEIQGQLDSRLEKSEMLLHNLRDYLMLSGESRNKVFARWCYENGLSINCPWISGIAVATNRNQPQWRIELPEAPNTWSEEQWETLGVTAHQNAIDCNIELRSNVTNRLRFLDDYGLQRSFDNRRDRLAISIRESRLSMGERRVVMQETNGNPSIGTLYYVPVYHPAVAEFLATPGLGRQQSGWARWMHLRSVIVAPVDFKMLEYAVWDGAPADLDFELFSSTNQASETWLNISEGTPRAADPAFKAYLTHRHVWPMYGQRFSIFFHTTPLFEARSPRRLAWVTIAAGTVLTLLAAALVGVALRARNRQEQLTDQIRDARDALAAAQREREKFSRDLHDGTIQSLYAIQLGLGHTVEKLLGEPAHAQSELSMVRRDLDTVIAEIRQFITAEAGSANKLVDLSAVMHAMVQRARNGSTTQVALQCDPEASERLTGDQAVQLANIAREALSNSLRHAQPRQVEIALRSDRETVVLEISDDGTGFNPGAPGRSGVGLTSMKARAREMGGTFEIRSSPGEGTRVMVRVPTHSLEPVEAESPPASTDQS